MFKFIYFKTEFKKIFREPIMAILFFAPMLISVIFRALLYFLVPIILEYIDFDISQYERYILAFILTINAMLLSIIIGFSMIDDKDNRIVELMSVTPMGKSGYLMIRLSVVFLAVFLYTVYSFFVLGLTIVSIKILIYIAMLLCVYSEVMGLLLFSIASDKVNGLTYAKGLTIVILFIFTDLFNLPWVSALGKLFPPYWITQIIAHPENMINLIFGFIVTISWLGLVLLLQKKQNN